MDGHPTSPEAPFPPAPSVERRFQLVEARITVLEQTKADKAWVESLVTAVREKLREDINSGIDRIHAVLLERQKLERNREAQEKALLNVCEETQALIKDFAGRFKAVAGAEE